MDKDFVYGTMDGDMTFGEYFEIPYAKVEGLRYPEVVLLGTGKGERNIYKKRMVKIQKDTLFIPDEDYGILGSHDYTFPDATQDVSDLIPALETLISGIDVNTKHNILEERGEDAFLYGSSTFDINDGKIFFLCLTKYREDNRSSANYFVGKMNTPYTKLALCFKAGVAGIRKSENYITHFAEKFVINYSAYVLQDNKADEVRELMNHNPDLKALDNQLGRALSDSLYMEALSKKIEEMISSLHSPKQSFQ